MNQGQRSKRTKKRCGVSSSAKATREASTHRCARRDRPRLNLSNSWVRHRSIVPSSRIWSNQPHASKRSRTRPVLSLLKRTVVELYAYMFAPAAFPVATLNESSHNQASCIRSPNVQTCCYSLPGYLTFHGIVMPS
jgi:hypothetical protein